MAYVCPDCKSENVQQIALIYGAGTSQVRSRSTAVGLDLHGHVGVGAMNTKGATQSALAQRFAPPRESNVSGTVGCLILLGLVIGLAAWASYGSFVYLPLAIATVGIVAGFVESTAKKYNNTTYRQQYEAWLRKFACLRCGSVFERTETDVASEGTQRYRILLTAVGTQKINIIKAAREITGLDLAAARDVVERTPWELKAAATKEEAEAVKRRLEDLGAAVELRPTP